MRSHVQPPRSPRCRAPGRTHHGAHTWWSTRFWRPRRRPAPAPTLLASGLVLCFLVLGACLLAMPGFVLGAEDVESRSVSEEAAPDVRADTQLEVCAEPTEISQGTVLAYLGWGNGPGQVGLSNPGEGLTRGPEAVAVSPDGRIAILDSVNSRIVLLDDGGGPVGTIPVELSEPRFLAVDDERIYVLDCDCDRRLLTLSWTGEELERIDLPKLPDVVTALFSTDHGPCLEIAHDNSYLLEQPGNSKHEARLRSLPGRPLDRGLDRAARASFRPADGFAVNTVSLDKGSLGARAEHAAVPDISGGRSLEHLVSMDGDGHDGLVVGARLLRDETIVDEAGDPIQGTSLVVAAATNSEDADLLLTHLTPVAARGATAESVAEATPAAGRAATASNVIPDLAPAGRLLLTDCAYAYVGQPYVVTPDGQVLQPVADDTGYRLLLHTFSPVAEVQP